MKFIHFWVIMAMITAGYGLVNKEQTASYAVVAVVLPVVLERLYAILSPDFVNIYSFCCLRMA